VSIIEADKKDLRGLFVRNNYKIAGPVMSLLGILILQGKYKEPLKNVYSRQQTPGASKKEKLWRQLLLRTRQDSIVGDDDTQRILE